MDTKQPSRHWTRSPLVIALFALATLVTGIFAWDHRIHVFTGDGLIVVLLLVCVGMHFFMHGGHGGHGSHSGRDGHTDHDDQRQR